VRDLATRRYPQLLAAALCVGLAAANAVRTGSTGVLLLAGAALVSGLAFEGPQRLAALAVGLALVGWSAGGGAARDWTRSTAALSLHTSGGRHSSGWS
jgi:hypothetical protein